MPSVSAVVGMGGVFHGNAEHAGEIIRQILAYFLLGFGRNTGQRLGQLLHEIELHLAGDLNPLRLRRPGPMHRLSQIPNGIASQRHILNQPEDTYTVFG